MAHAGPSIVLASATDILAFLSAATVPIPAIQYFCLSCGICLFVNLGLVLTFFVSVLYMVEHGREKRNKEELGADELAQLKASVGLSNGSKFCINLGELLTRGWCKVLPRSRALVVYLQRALSNAGSLYRCDKRA